MDHQHQMLSNMYNIKKIIYFLKMNFTMILSKKDSSKIDIAIRIEYIRRQNL